MSSLVDQPFDKYWDSPLTRREAQRAINKLSSNDSELMSMVDTSSLVLNYVCEKLNITREDLEDYVSRKKAEVAALKSSVDSQADGIK